MTAVVHVAARDPPPLTHTTTRGAFGNPAGRGRTGVVASSRRTGSSGPAGLPLSPAARTRSA